MRNFYWAHPFDSRHLHMEWKIAFQKIGINLVDPFYDLTRVDVEEIDSGRADRYEKLDPTKLVERDLDAIRKSDGVIALVDGSLSYGTIKEIVYAYGIGHHQTTYRQFPVYLIVTNGHHEHPWLEFHATDLFVSLEQALEILEGVQNEKVS